MYRLLIAAAFLVSICTIPSVKGIKEDSNGILLLKEKNFDEAINKNKEIFVTFYNPSILSNAKDWVKAAAPRLKNVRRKIRMGEINIIENHGIRQRYNNIIRDFPALIYFKDGQFTLSYYITEITTRDVIENWILCRALTIEGCRYKFTPL